MLLLRHLLVLVSSLWVSRKLWVPTAIVPRVVQWRLQCSLQPHAGTQSDIKVVSASQPSFAWFSVKWASKIAPVLPAPAGRNVPYSIQRARPLSPALTKILRTQNRTTAKTAVKASDRKREISVFLTGALCLSAGRGVLRLTRLPRHDRGPVPGGNRSAASCLCTVLRRALYHYSTRSPKKTRMSVGGHISTVFRGSGLVP